MLSRTAGVSLGLVCAHPFGWWVEETLILRSFSDDPPIAFGITCSGGRLLSCSIFLLNTKIRLVFVAPRMYLSGCLDVWRVDGRGVDIGPPYEIHHGDPPTERRPRTDIQEGR